MISSDNTSNDLFKQALIIWSIIGPILGGIIGFIAKALLSGYQIRQQESRSARSNFMSAFSPLRREIEDVGYKNSIVDIDKILNSYHPIIKEAKITFSNTLSNRKKRALQRLWLEYCDEDEQRINQPIRYIPLSLKESGENKTIIEMRDAVLKTINELLKFVK